MKGSYNIAVIGGGIVGVACAYHAALAGRNVALFERHEKPVGATIRNFGMVWPIGQPSERMDLVMRSRANWLEVARKTGMWIRNDGSLHVAYFNDEWQVLQEFVQDAASKGYDVVLLTPKQCLERSPGLNPVGLIGGMYSRTELNIDPRQALNLLHNYLAEKLGVAIHYRTAISHIDGNRLSGAGQEWRADQIIVASGADLTTLYPGWHNSASLTQSKLQMMRTFAQDRDYNLGANLAAGLTLLHYASFSECPGLSRVRERFQSEMPEYLDHGIHVMVSATSKNELTIGDSHEYGRDFPPFNHARINELILDYLGRFLLTPKIRIAETWNGVYTKTTDGSMYWTAEPESGVLLVNGLGGAGMTLSFGVAQEVINHL